MGFHIGDVALYRGQYPCRIISNCSTNPFMVQFLEDYHPEDATYNPYLKGWVRWCCDGLLIAQIADDIKVQFDRRFEAPLGGGIWLCGAGNLRHVDAVELQPPTISLEEVL